MVMENFPAVTYLATGTNLGAVARNVGVAAASGDIVVTLDDDVFGLDDVGLANIRSLFSSDPALGAVNFRVIGDKTGEVCNWVHHCRPDLYGDREFPTYEITEGAVAFRKEALNIAGLYTEYFFISHEGVDLALRLWENGFKVIYSPDISVRHCHAAQGRKSWRRYYFDTRNQFWLVARHLPPLYGFYYLLRGILPMAAYSLRDRHFLYWLKGMADGALGMGRALDERRVLSRQTMGIIRSINRNRADWRYLARKRFLRKGVSI
jgi:GT2 family glycosyltransferase